MKSYLLMAAPSDQKMEFKQYDSFLAILPQGSQHPHTNQRLAFQNGLTSGLVRSNGAVSVVHGYLPALWSPAQMVCGLLCFCSAHCIFRAHYGFWPDPCAGPETTPKRFLFVIDNTTLAYYQCSSSNLDQGTFKFSQCILTFSMSIGTGTHRVEPFVIVIGR
jgi:hypothetical protein